MKKLFLTLISILFSIHNSTAQKIQPTYKNISYGPHQDMTLNFWKFESESPVPLLVHIHGGGWIGGKKNETISPNELKKGYSFASIDYRLAGTELLPAAVHDAARAIQFCAQSKRMELQSGPYRRDWWFSRCGFKSLACLSRRHGRSKSDDPVLRQSSRVCGALPWAGRQLSIHFFSKKDWSSVHSACNDLENRGS